MLKNSLHRRTALRLIALSPKAKAFIICSQDLLVLVLVAVAVLALSPRDALTFGEKLSSFFWIAAPVVTVLALQMSGIYRVIVRFFNAGHMLRIIFSAAIGGAAGVAAANEIRPELVAWHDGLLYVTGGGTLLILTRGIAAQLLRPAQTDALAARAIIYGAGAAGIQLAAALQTSGRFRPVAFVDDSPELQGRTLLGLPVLAPVKLKLLRERGKFDQILLALPSIKGTRRRRLLESLAQLSTKVMVMPSLEELANGQYEVDALHDVDVGDLLSRESVEPNVFLLERHIRGKSVMVTGAAGSIGAELCRQALRHGAIRLVLVDHSEFGLYSIEQELQLAARRVGCEIVAVLASVTDDECMRDLMRREAVSSVYHAAAYKHVTLVEQNVLSAVRNNVYGTLAVARAALECGVANLVLVSTDKAVRPTSVMGATKRICELIVQALAANQTKTSMSLVRFGNVLASSGSVIPLFLKQIKEGGPITVTHPEVTRYFMTIGEAAQLVIQAGAMGKRGEVFVLDMGEPIKIMALAERIIRLSGLEVRSPETPHGDIAIEITGLRPGEKLHEELLLAQQARPTVHPRISQTSESFLPWEQLEIRLHTLRIAVANGSREHVLRLVHEIASGASEADAVQDRGVSAIEWLPSQRLAAERSF